MRWQRVAVVAVVAIVAACSKPSSSGVGSAAAIGSAAGSAIAPVPADAAAIAIDAAVQLNHGCSVAPPGVHCTLGPIGGAWHKSACWRAIVAIEDHVAATVRFVTTQQTCTGELAAGTHNDVAFAFGPKDDLGTLCDPDGACEIDLVEAASVASEIASWRKELLGQLGRERAEREQDERDREPATVDTTALIKKLAEVTVNEDWQRPHDEVAREVYSAGEMALPRNAVYTKGQLRCAFASTTATEFRSCFEQYLPIDAGVDDAGDPGDANGDVVH